MALALSSPLGSPVTIHFSGESVDQMGIEVDELLTALEGWREFIEVASTLHLRGTLSPVPLPPEQRVGMTVHRVGPGNSLEVELFLWAAGTFVATTIAKKEIEQAWPVVKAKIWHLATKLFTKHVEQKRESRSLEEVAAALQQVCAADGIKVDDESDPEEVATLVDTAIRKATDPLDGAVSEITVEMPGSNEAIEVRRVHRTALDAPLERKAAPARADQPFRAAVEFVRVNLKNATGAIRFASPSTDDQRGIRGCKIIDRAGLKRSRDCYTGSLHRRSPVTLWVRKATVDSDSGAFRWEVSQSEFPTHPELFESNAADTGQPDA